MEKRLAGCVCFGQPWRSLVLLVALEAALLRQSNEDRIDVRAAVEELHKVSIIDLHESMQPVDLEHGLEPRVNRFFAAVSDELQKGRVTLNARQYSPAWLLLAHLIKGAGRDNKGSG